MEIRLAVGAATLAVLCFPGDVLKFALTTIKPGVRSADASSTFAEATDFGRLIGDRVASAIVGSPLYPFLKKQAKDTMSEHYNY